jgi:hypothetical protein
MRNEKISFAKLKLTNNKQLAANHRQNPVRLFNSISRFFSKISLFLDDSYSQFNA